MASITKTGEWTENFEGTFRILVLDRCDNCGVNEAHALEYRGETDTKCLICLKVVELADDAEVPVTPKLAAAGVVARNFRTPVEGDTVGWLRANANNQYRVTAVGTDWAEIENAGLKWSASFSEIVFHDQAKCGCNSCRRSR